MRKGVTVMLTCIGINISSWKCIFSRGSRSPAFLMKCPTFLAKSIYFLHMWSFWSRYFYDVKWFDVSLLIHSPWIRTETQNSNLVKMCVNPLKIMEIKCRRMIPASHPGADGLRTWRVEHLLDSDVKGRWILLGQLVGGIKKMWVCICLSFWLWTFTDI